MTLRAAMGAACLIIAGCHHGSAAEQLAERCRSGDGNACTQLAELYAGGNGVVRDPVHAFQLDQRGCQLRDDGACFEVAIKLARGDGVTADPGRAVTMFEAQCRAHEDISCYRAARMLDNAKSAQRALALYRTACDGPYLPACFRAGEMLEGGIGAAPDAMLAADYFLRSCDGSMPRRSRPPDRHCDAMARASSLYQNACAAGDKRACRAARALAHGTWP